MLFVVQYFSLGRKVNGAFVFCSTYLYPNDWYRKLSTFCVEFCSWLLRRRAKHVRIRQPHRPTLDISFASSREVVVGQRPIYARSRKM